MSLFLLLPETVTYHLLKPLLGILGADEQLTSGIWTRTIEDLTEAAGQAISKYRLWSVYEASTPEAERLMMVSDAVTEQLGERGEAVLDLEAKLVTLPELLEIAEGLGLSVGLVAVLKRLDPKLAPLQDQGDRDLVAAIRAIGRQASIGQILNRVGGDRVKVRKRLQVLAKFGRLVSTGTKGSRRYSLPSEGE